MIEIDAKGQIPSQTLEQKIAEWDQKIKDGLVEDVRHECRSLKRNQIPRELLVQLCHIARRVNLPEYILYWLGPIVTGLSTKRFAKKGPEVSTQELSIYSLALSRMGAFAEAEKRLKSLNPELDPEIHFYRASLYMNQWKYDQALPELKKYVKDARLSEYSRQVGLVNLCASCIALGRMKETQREIEKFLRRKSNAGLLRLKGNIYQIKAQYLFEMGDLEGAHAEILRAQETLKQDLLGTLVVRKWEAIANFRRYQNGEKFREDMADIKKAGASSKQWEIVRDCDFQTAIHLKDPICFNQVFWGTRFSSYKKRVMAHVPQGVQIQREYDWELAYEPFGLQTLEPLDQTITKKQVTLAELNLSASLKKLAVILCSEHYRPLRLTEIFEDLYEGEYFNILSSRIRLNRLIRRLNRHFEDHKIPLLVARYTDGLQLKSREPGLYIRIFSDVDEQNASEEDFKKNWYERLKRFIQGLEGPEFSVSDFMGHFTMSRRSAQRELQQLSKRGIIDIKGHGKSTRYLLHPIDS